MAEKIIYTIADGVFLFLIMVALIGYSEAEFPYDAVEYFYEVKEILGRWLW